MTSVEFEKTVRAWRMHPSVVVSGATLAGAQEALKTIKMKQDEIADLQAKLNAIVASLNLNLADAEKMRQLILNGFRATYGLDSAEYKEAAGQV
jgi:hypothetical protein